MKDLILALISVFYLLVLYSIGAEANTEKSLTITGFSIKPNYPLTADENDAAQLADGITHRYPPWTNRGSVGWQGRTPVRIDIRLGGEHAENDNSGVLRIFAPEGNDSNRVHIPRRVDVYSVLDESLYRHEASLIVNESQFKNDQNYWISIPLENVSKKLALIVHAQGKLIMIDEISWQPSVATGVQKQVKSESPVKDIMLDSRNRLKQHYINASSAPKTKFDDWKNQFKQDVLYYWNQNPWTGIHRYPEHKDIDFGEKDIKLVGVNSEIESACIGLLNTSDTPVKIVLHVLTQNADRANVEIGELDAVMSASGKRVYDPVLPLPDNAILLKPYEVSYIWLTLDLTGMAIGENHLKIQLVSESGALQQEIPITVEVRKIQRWSASLPRAITWAYYQDWPIWDNKELALNDLIEHGVNVFVIHGATIPQPNLEKAWENRKMKQFREQLDFYSGHGTILLFMGWSILYDMHKAPEWRQKEAVQWWAHRMKMEMLKAGLSPEDWAVYPVDEPRGERLEFLKKVAVWIKEVDVSIQIYANPIEEPGRFRNGPDLDSLDKYIDLWQPSYSLASKSDGEYFHKLPRQWWVYDGPRPPAKDAKPWLYRQMAWNAWKIGAKGIGFWSYSATNHSSAWDDFDGPGPDWSVVYESEHGPITSRRWEAFREGVEDYKLLDAYSNIGSGSCKLTRDELRSKIERLSNTKPQFYKDAENVRRSIILDDCLKTETKL